MLTLTLTMDSPLLYEDSFGVLHHPPTSRRGPLKKFAVALLALATLAFLGTTIWLAVTRMRTTTPPVPCGNTQDTSCGNTQDTSCGNIPGYVVSFLDIDDVAENYSLEMERGDALLFFSMLKSEKAFEQGRLALLEQAETLKGAVRAANRLGSGCKNPMNVTKAVSSRIALTSNYAKMNYEEFIALQEEL